jgi:hypothetical protein
MRDWSPRHGWWHFPLALLIGALTLPIGARVMMGPRGADIHIRWAPALDAGTRMQLEARFHLADGDRLDTSTWRYDLLDPSNDNIRSLVSNSAVEDTHGLDRARFSVSTAARTGRRLRSGVGDVVVLAADRISVVLAVLAAILGVAGVSGRAFTWKGAAGVLASRVRSFRVPNSAVRNRTVGLETAVEIGPGRPRLWTGVTLVAAAPFVVMLCVILWRTPIPISEAVALLEDGLDLPLASYWSPNDAYYRPLFHVALVVLWGIDHLEVRLGSLKLLTIVPIAVMVVTVVWHLRPKTLLDAAAALVAVAVLIGSPGFRDNLEVVLPYTIMGMCMAAIVWMLLEREERAWTLPLVVACALLAIGFKEQGLVILPVIVIAWWMRAPGATRGLAATAVLIAVAYVGFRLSGSAVWAPFEQDVGLGFTEIGRNEAAARYGAFPYFIYAYNSASTISNVLFSEPTRGVFREVRAILDRDPQIGLTFAVASSCLLTALIVSWGFRSLRGVRLGQWSPESRIFVALVVALLASGALSFNYSRERLGGMAVVFYAMAAFHAVRATSLRLSRASRLRFVAIAAVLVLLSTSWSLRAFATLEYTRGDAFANQREWFVLLPEREVSFARRQTYQRLLATLKEQGRDVSAPRPTHYPRWLAQLIGQQ